MRFYVEVATLRSLPTDGTLQGTSGGASDRPPSVVDFKIACIEAASWQQALTTARTKLGHDAPMTNVTIEARGDGWRALDAQTCMRFDVREAPADAKLTEFPATFPIVSPSSRPAPPPSFAPPASATSSVPPPSAPSSGAPSAPPPSSSRMAARRRTPPPPVVARVLLRREESPTEQRPLTYREVAYCVPPGCSESQAADMLRRELHVIRGSLASAGAGQLVQLAAFDEVDGQKPRGLPVAALTWKDWRGEPVVTFPRKGEVGPRFSLPPSASKVAVTSAAPAASSPATPAPALPVLEPAPTPPIAEPTPSHPLSVSKRAAARLRNSSPDNLVRLSGSDLMADLFESVHDLHFLRDALDGAAFCQALFQDKVPCRLGYVHFFDVERRQYLLVKIHGVASDGLVLQAAPAQDVVLSRAARERKGVLLDESALSSVALPARYDVGPSGQRVRSVVAAAVSLGARPLAVFECVDPLDGKPFVPGDLEALSYVAEQFGAFVSSHGLVFDKRAIARASR